MWRLDGHKVKMQFYGKPLCLRQTGDEAVWMFQLVAHTERMETE